jgi:hypothetical protein
MRARGGSGLALSSSSLLLVPRQIKMRIRGRGVCLPQISVVAAQLAELGKMNVEDAGCEGPLVLPKDAFAIPIAWAHRHNQASGADELIAALLRDEAVRADARKRNAALDRIQTAIRPKSPASPVRREPLKRI